MPRAYPKKERRAARPAVEEGAGASPGLELRDLERDDLRRRVGARIEIGSVRPTTWTEVPCAIPGSTFVIAVTRTSLPEIVQWPSGTLDGLAAGGRD
jgi:hypothetical protein